MRYHRVWPTVIALFIAAGCGGRHIDMAAPATIEHLHGSSATISYLPAASGAQISVARVEPGGTFLRLRLAPGQQLAAERWEHDRGTLHLVAPVDGGLDIGIVGLGDYSGGPVSLSLQFSRGVTKSSSRPPTGAHNVIPDLAVGDAGAGQVSLAWTQRNVGDYDFNGEVNIADLTPLGQHFNEVVDRAAAGADLLTEFWVDGDENGEINLADLTVIGQNYTAFIAGYNIRRNGTVVLNGQGQTPTVASAEATPRAGLPPVYSLLFTGLTTDTWLVTSVDAAGEEGADSGGGLGPVDLYLDLNISGADLLNLIGSGSGPFGPGKFSSRVIDPIDIVQNAPLGTTSLLGTSAQVRGLPRGKTLLARAQFAPTVSLATGAPKGAASLKSSSDVSEEESEFISVPFKLPIGTDPVSMSMDISLTPAPTGYYVTLTAILDVYGDDPATPAIETKYVKTYTNRLEYATGKVSRDTDGDDIFDGEEAEYGDDDRDCISEMEVENESDWDEHEDDDELEYRSESATLANIDFAAGTATFANIIPKEPEDWVPPATLTVPLREETDYEGPNDTELADLSELLTQPTVKFRLKAILPVGGDPLFWCEEIELEGPDD